jgi:hypothetical protein
MGFFQDIKLKIGWYMFKRERPALRKVETANLDTASKVGLLFRVEAESDFILVKQYRKHLMGEYGIKHVEAMGWMDEKVAPDFTTLHRGFGFINPEKVNWYYKPVSPEAAEFVTARFDILVDLTDKPILPLRFLLKQSDASLKVGKYSESDYRLYDLTINLQPNTLLDEYLKQVERYLKLIKK